MPLLMNFLKISISIGHYTQMKKKSLQEGSKNGYFFIQKQINRSFW